MVPKTGTILGNNWAEFGYDNNHIIFWAEFGLESGKKWAENGLIFP